MAKTIYVPKVPRRFDFCGAPPCPLCFNPVTLDDQPIPSFQELMREIYKGGPAPQNEKEYELAHVAAHQTRRELDDRLREADEAQMTHRQVEALLRNKQCEARAPKPLNRVNCDDLAAKEAPEQQEKEAQKEQAPVKVPVTVPAYGNQFQGLVSAYKQAMLEQQAQLSAATQVANNLSISRFVDQRAYELYTPKKSYDTPW